MTPLELFESQLSLPRIITYKIARKFKLQPLVEDLTQEGLLGLWRAANKFDSSKEVKFRTFAEHFIRGACLEYVRQKSGIVRKSKVGFFTTPFVEYVTDDSPQALTIPANDPFPLIEQRDRLRRQLEDLTEQEFTVISRLFVFEDHDSWAPRLSNIRKKEYLRVKRSAFEKLGLPLKGS